MAELAMKRGALQEARQYEEQAVEWALARDNKAVLCAAACMAARIKLIKAEQDAVRRDDLIRGAAENVEAGLRIARPCGFALLHIDLLKTRSLVLLMQGKPTEAQHDLRVALFEGVHPHEESGFPELLAATDPKCGYAIGEAECRRRLAEALLLEAASAPEPNALVEQACEHLRLSIELFRRMNDPEVSATENLLEMARSGWRTAYPIRNMNQPAVVPPKKKQTMKPPVDFVIIAPLDEERDALLRKLKGWWKLPPSDEDIRVYFAAQLPVEFPDGSKAAYNIVVVPLADMGEQEAGNATHDAIRRWSPRFVLLVGIAGGLRKAEVGCGDVLIANQVADYELQKRTMDGTTIRWRVHPVNQQLLLASKNFLGDDWMQWINEPRPFGGTPKRRTGVICTGNKVIADGLANTYHETWERLIGVEMEAGGVAGAAFSRVNPPGFFMIRGVSDLADKDKDSTQTKSWRAYACDVAASYAMAFLTSGPVKASNG
jgi:nucleoside phosphorylase